MTSYAINTSLSAKQQICSPVDLLCRSCDRWTAGLTKKSGSYSALSNQNVHLWATESISSLFDNQRGSSYWHACEDSTNCPPGHPSLRFPHWVMYDFGPEAHLN
eukprot:TRINITY_DN5708_c0_g1_i1.p1 TRINITY_DN5708_c0_g1~~TRINITY_DN5708_c0_g1_i1.p1  ORF type:complete len:104 (+),score=2.25 TRINITY_DN5708_c0_g1_i1:595-906(+)